MKAPYVLSLADTEYLLSWNGFSQYVLLPRLSSISQRSVSRGADGFPAVHHLQSEGALPGQEPRARGGMLAGSQTPDLGMLDNLSFAHGCQQGHTLGQGL